MKETAPHIKLGMFGEKIALRMLRAKGFDILGYNVHLPHAQVDITARDGLSFVIVEVKTRNMRPGQPFPPAKDLRRDQQERLRKAGYDLLKKYRTREFPVRIDLVEIFVHRGQPDFIRHHIGFFDPHLHRLTP